MEIAKEKFIETFKKECENAVKSINIDAFRINSSSESSIEIVPNEKVSFFAIKMSNNDNGFQFLGKILFSGFVDYKSIDLTEEEFESLYDFCTKSELETRLAIKNKIISEGEAILEKIVS